MEVAVVNNGEEKFETFKSSVTKRIMVQYDYRSMDGEIFSCVKPSLVECRKERDEWLSEKTNKN